MRQSENRTADGRRTMLPLLLAVCMAAAAFTAPMTYAAETSEGASPAMEKSRSQNPSQNKGTKNIQAAKNEAKHKSLPKATGKNRTGLPKAAENSYDIHISGEYRQAEAYEMLDYANQNRGYDNQLRWDNELEKLSMTYAAELPVNFSTDVRPNGQKSTATYIAKNYDSAGELYWALYGDSADDEYFDYNSTYTYFAAAAFKASNDVTYWVVIFQDKPMGNTKPVNKNYEDDNAYVNVTDDYLNWKSSFMNVDEEEYPPKELQKGEIYYVWIDVYNYNEDCSEDVPIYLQTQYSTSSDTDVLTIDRLGTIKTKNFGTSTVKVSPNQKSDRKESWNCTVRQKSTNTEPLYKQCAGKAYFSKLKDKYSGEYVCIKFIKASNGKITFRLANGFVATENQVRTNTITGKASGKTIKFKIKKWYYDDGISSSSWKDGRSGTITIVNNKTVKIKLTSGRYNHNSEFKKLKVGKTVTLNYVKNSDDYWEPWH